MKLSNKVKSIIAGLALLIIGAVTNQHTQVIQGVAGVFGAVAAEDQTVVQRGEKNVVQ